MLLVLRFYQNIKKAYHGIQGPLDEQNADLEIGEICVFNLREMHFYFFVR